MTTNRPGNKTGVNNKVKERATKAIHLLESVKTDAIEHNQSNAAYLISRTIEELKIYRHYLDTIV